MSAAGIGGVFFRAKDALVLQAGHIREAARPGVEGPPRIRRRHRIWKAGWCISPDQPGNRHAFDAGKDRLFEGRQQHDEAEKNSEKTRLARDVARHHHPTDDADADADAGTGTSAKRKS